MTPLTYATSNVVKFRTASTIAKKYKVRIEQLGIDAQEMQASDGETVARDKALRIYEDLKRPIVISDDSWLIPGLRNFPGPYMKFVNATFTAEDWLRLTKPLTDRRIILRQIVVYQDENEQRLFYVDVEGTLLTKIRGQSIYPHTCIVSFDQGKNSAAEIIAKHGSAIASSNLPTSWDSFFTWYKAKSSEIN